MRGELIWLTKKEHERLEVVRRVMRHELKQNVAAEVLGLSTRHVKNLVRKVDRDGAKGLAHGNRGKPRCLTSVSASIIIRPRKRRGKYMPRGLATVHRTKRDSLSA